MEVLDLVATQFIKPMSTGRNRPLLLGCENTAEDRFEVVVKFRGRQMNPEAQIAELITAQLAEDLGLQVPQAAVVEVPTGFDSIVPDPELASMVKTSVGKNFGSVHLGAGFTTWPSGREPYGVQRDQAAEIFAFDALIQNPDRRAENPNLWARSDRLGVYDHEQAFSFLILPIIGGAPKPWAVTNQGNSFRFLEQHIFYRSLRAGRLDLGPFREKLSTLSNNDIETYADAVPLEWQDSNEFCSHVADYLGEARENADTLIQFVKHLLR